MLWHTRNSVISISQFSASFSCVYNFLLSLSAVNYVLLCYLVLCARNMNRAL